MNDPSAQLMAALSRSASSKTTAEALPPSSKRTGLMCLPAVEAIIEPTLVLPVKLTLRTAGWAMRAVVTAAASETWWKTTFKHPAGRPACRKISPRAQKHLGESSEPLRTTVLPAARGRATARVPKMKGAFLHWITKYPWLVTQSQKSRLLMVGGSAFNGMQNLPGRN